MERNNKKMKMNLDYDERRSSKPKPKKVPKRMAYDPDEFESFEEMMDYRSVLEDGSSDIDSLE